MKRPKRRCGLKNADTISMTRSSRRTGKLIPFAKIGDDAVLRIVQGFACAEPIATIAEATGVSEKTCRSVVLALRYRLFRAPFNHWRIRSHRLMAVEIEDQALIGALLYGHYAKCYFKRGCFTNFQQGLRASRVCRSCPIRQISDPDDDLAADLYHIDLVHNFYGLLGIGGERGLLPLTLFRLRHAHTHVVGTAYEATRKSKDMTPDFADRRFGTACALYQALIRDLEAEALVRFTGPIDVMDEEFGDLKWLND